MAKQKYNPRESQRDFRGMAFGDKGFVVVNSGDAPTKYIYRAITVLEDAVITVKQINVEGHPDTNLTLTAGTTIYGMFDPINVTSGTIIAYIG